MSPEDVPNDSMEMREVGDHVRPGGDHIADIRDRLLARENELEALQRQLESARTDLEALQRSTRRTEQQFADIRSYCEWLERRHVDMLNSTSWRAMEPVRRVMRTVTRKKPPVPFTPRFPTTTTNKSYRIVPEASKKKLLASGLEDKLWGGFADAALSDLEDLKASGLQRRVERSAAAWALARWYAAREDFTQAHENIVLMAEFDPTKRLVMRRLLLESDCLGRLGKPEAARALIAEGLRSKPGNADLCLAMANTFLHDPGLADGDDQRLGWINRIYANADLLPLALHDPAGGLTLDNLAAPAGGAAGTGADQPKISVLMPAFRAADTLPFALRGLLAQTWANLEIIVVDDCSPDDTAAVAEAIAARDPRVRVLRQPRNRGSYAARNAGLLAATGDFITTHDADDWSHPQKLELQVRHALRNPAVAATLSSWVRSRSDLRASWLLRAWGGYIGKNMSSIMLRREAFAALGGWDEVLVGGDTDLLRRAEQLFGAKAIVQVHTGIPLAFSLHEERSLTRQSNSHVRTMLYGARREYNEAGAYWRSQASPSDLRLDPSPKPGGRPFPAPLPILGRGDARHELDVLFVGDFCFRGGAFVSTLNYVEAALRAQRSSGVFHWRRYDLDGTQPLNPKLRQLAQEGAITIVSPGERVRAGTVVVGYPAILTHPVDLFPELDLDALVVVINQMASRLHSGGDVQYDPAEVRADLRRIFGTEGIWVPISGLVRRLMSVDRRYPPPSETIWFPLIDTETWCAEPVRWRGGDGRPPVIGRHARDHYTKWPTTAAALSQAYCADRPCRIEIMGGAERALAVLGSEPENWTVYPFGSMGAEEFLRRLDFFVHYPHEDYIEEFGRAVLEALASGLPAVLPPVFRETFGPAAVYAEPPEVWSTIHALWRNEAAYLAQAERGRGFVMAESDWAQFPDRLARTLAGSRTARAALQDSTA